MKVHMQASSASRWNTTDRLRGLKLRGLLFFGTHIVSTHAFNSSSWVSVGLERNHSEKGLDSSVFMVQCSSRVKKIIKCFPFETYFQWMFLTGSKIFYLKCRADWFFFQKHLSNICTFTEKLFRCFFQSFETTTTSTAQHQPETTKWPRQNYKRRKQTRK